ncbi:Wax ester synthase/diacylglycerol acyltransferase 11-like protein [Drosera capensis]
MHLMQITSHLLTYFCRTFVLCIDIFYQKMVGSVSMAMEKGDLRVRTKAPTTSTVEYSDDRDHDGEYDAAWMKEMEEEEPLSPCGRLYHTPCLSTSIVVLFGFATKIDLDMLKEQMERMSIRHPRFSSKLVLDVKKGEKERWVRTKVDWDHHIIVLDLGQDIENPDQFIDDYASDLSSTPFNLSKPLWEFHVLNIKTSNAESVGIFKIHHSLGDGMSLVALIFSCSRKSSSPEELPSIPTSSTKRVAKITQGGFYRFLIAIWLILRFIWNTVTGIGQLLATASFLRDTNSLISLKVDRGTPKKIVHRLVSVDDIKLVKNETNTTVNDVIVGLTDAALSRYLNVMPGDHRRRKIRLRASIAVNARKTVGVQDLVDMMEKGSKCKWGNVTGCIMIPFDVTLEKDPLEHVRKAKLVIDRKKLSLEAKFAYYLTSLGAKVLGMKFLVSLLYRFMSNTTMLLSTVTGPAEEVDFCGHRVAYICGTARTAGGHPPGLVIHYMSYVNKMSVAVCANQDLIPDPHKILDEVEESLKLMKNAVLQRKQSKKGLLSN